MFARRPLALAAALSVLALGAAPAQESRARAGLRYAFEVGKTQRQACTWRLVQTQDFSGLIPPQTTTVELVYGVDEKVTAVAPDGAATVEATITTIRGQVAMGMMMGEMAYDSATDDAGSPLRFMRHLVGKTYTFTITPAGAVTAVTGGDAIRAALIEAAKADGKPADDKPAAGGRRRRGGMPDAGGMAQTFATQLSVVFTDASIKSALEVTRNVLPEAADAAEGATWTRTYAEVLPRIGTMRFTSNQAHRGAGDGVVRLTGRSTGEVELVRDEGKGEAGEDAMAGMAREMQRQMAEKMEVKRKQVTHAVQFDPAAGALRESEVKHTIDMEGPIPPMIAAMMGELPPDARSQQKIELVLRVARAEAK